MVQRKLPNNKLGIQFQGDHHVKLEKQLGSFKPSSCHQKLQESAGKNKGTDLKKIMKKSSSSNLKKTFAQPGKPPPPAAAATPKKKPIMSSKAAAIDGSSSSPNYMKSTSSSEAKKEVSHNHQVSSALCRRSTGSKTSSVSCNKPTARTLTKASSLKLVRTLTKSPSFKPAVKNFSKVAALCTDHMNVEKATCSSTLKDSKFPAFLMLNPGGTESQGTSTIKVCPYTYCSLNGHHRTPSPPLKYFLKARRRSLKTQRSMKNMEANLRQRGVNPSAADVRRQQEFDEEEDLGKSPTDFLVEIYAKREGNDVEETRGIGTVMNAGAAKGMDESGETEKPVSETLSEGSPHSEIDFDEIIISKVDTAEAINDELKHNNVDDEEFGRISVKEEPSPWSLTDVNDKQDVFEVIDMEWGEEWQFSASEPDSEANSSMESDSNIGDSSETHRIDLLDELETSSDEIDSNLDDGAEQVFEEDTACVDTRSQVYEILCYDQVSSTEEMFEVSMPMKEKEEEEENTVTGKEKMVENGVPETVEEVSTADSLPEVSENSFSIDLKEETSDKLEQEETNGVSEADDQTEKELLSNGGADEEMLIGIQGSSHDVLPVADKDGNENKQQICEVINGEDEDEDNFKVLTSMDSEEHNSSRMHPTGLAEGSEEVRNKSCHNPRTRPSFTGSNAKGEVADNHNNIKWRIGQGKRQEENNEEGKEFNPREPNFLPVVPEPDAEKVDLRNQMMDERKKSEEWMLDHALQQAVTKLAPARKRKVALLVEAFETILPVTHSRHCSAGFTHGRHIQACN